MADGTKIEWTDATWNVVNGCSVVSPGCTNCYAMRLAGTRMRHHPSRAGLTRDTKAGPVWNGEVRFNDKVLLDPLRWRRPRRIFVCAHGDLFHEAVPDEWIDRVFAVMALAPQHVFQVLTKRPERMRAYFTHDGGFGRWGFIEQQARKLAKVPDHRTLATFGGSNLPHVWLGVSIEDQARADERIPLLLATPAAVRWLSCEPLLGPVDLAKLRPDGINFTLDALTGRGEHLLGYRGQTGKIDWVVAGGESGPGARPMHPAWARSLRDQCAAAGVPFLFKQWGEWLPDPEADALGDEIDGAPFLIWHADSWRNLPQDHIGDYTFRIGKKRAGRLLDGQLHDGFPA